MAEAHLVVDRNCLVIPIPCLICLHTCSDIYVLHCDSVFDGLASGLAEFCSCMLCLIRYFEFDTTPFVDLNSMELFPNLTIYYFVE